MRAVLYFRELVAVFLPWRPGLHPKSSHVGFVVDTTALGQVFSAYFGSVDGAIGQTMADESTGLSLSRLQDTKKMSNDDETVFVTKYILIPIMNGVNPYSLFNRIIQMLLFIE
jgi:hypothetical protein